MYKAFAASSELEVNATHKDRLPVDYVMNGHQYQLPDGAVVIAAITSCTNTSNPSVLMAAGLLAKKAVTLGLKRQPWVKASLARVRKSFLIIWQSELTPYLDELGFNLVGYGCTTCIVTRDVARSYRNGNQKRRFNRRCSAVRQP
ncbi:aconitase family protein [Escherichia coli]|uniref:aconitase family protein n=1 Tax=Escherichia coli TaxID=562 RepID=UPI000F670998|nr:hypothetical protein EGT48_27065 [Escherichia coli]